MQLSESFHTEGRNKFYVLLAYFIHRKHSKACEFKLSSLILERSHHWHTSKSGTWWIQSNLAD